MDDKHAFALVAEVASPSDDEGLKQPRATLLLWFLRNVFGVDDLLAYEYICDGQNDHGIDGLWLENEGEEDETLVVLQSKYPEKLKNCGVNELKEFVGSAEQISTSKGVDGILRQNVEPELVELLKRFEVREKLDNKKLKIRLVFVVAGVLTQQAEKFVEALNAKHGRPYLTCHDLRRLGPSIEAFKTPTTVKAVVKIPCATTERFVASHGTARVLVCSVRADDIVKWPGIDDRTLFDLNVRRELRRNAVRSALDKAIGKATDHPNFLAFHNGLTVVCEKFDESLPDSVTIKNMSVVNGAQSTVALRANASKLSDKLRVLVKFVEVEPAKQLAREVTIRSNTQNPVTPRNLRARDGIQLRLVAEFKDRFPKITFETRPDLTKPTTVHAIQNDVAAQLLCAVFNEQPWVAVHKLRLFDAETYPSVFSEKIHAEHVVLVDRIAAAVQARRDRFPEAYRQSWQLTKLVAVYLVGQLLRTNSESGKLLEFPGREMEAKKTPKLLDTLARFSAATLSTRADQKMQKSEHDNFKVEFNRESSLKELASVARANFIVHQAMDEE